MQAPIEESNAVEIPQEIKLLIAKYHVGGISGSECLACSSGCCSQSGFAILENVIAIYELYKQGKLKRKGFKFSKRLSFNDFVFSHFDNYIKMVGPEEHQEGLVQFYPKSIDDRGRLVTIPGGAEFYETRRQLFRDNPWLGRGCIFLSHPCPNWPEDDGYSKRHCILHTPDCYTILGPKPIDCLFYTCAKPYDPVCPSKEESDAWHATLSRAFPRSIERLQRLSPTFDHFWTKLQNHSDKPNQAGEFGEQTIPHGQDIRGV
jgi:hypothetical protein